MEQVKPIGFNRGGGVTSSLKIGKYRDLSREEISDLIYENFRYPQLARFSAVIRWIYPIPKYFYHPHIYDSKVTHIQIQWRGTYLLIYLMKKGKTGHGFKRFDKRHELVYKKTITNIIDVIEMLGNKKDFRWNINWTEWQKIT